jgi:hypothetical protein
MSDELEPSPAMQAKIDQRVAFIKEATGFTKNLQVSKTHIMSMLTEPPPGATVAQQKVWDQSCDLCGKHTQQLKMGTAEEPWRSMTITIVFGLCPDCVAQMQ